MRYVRLFGLSLLVCAGILSLFHLIVQTGYRKYNRVEAEKMDEILKGKEYYDILVIGSSRAYQHINPAIVDSITGLQSFNAGVPAATLLETSMILQCYLKSHKPPKLVVMEIAWAAFDIDRRPIWNPNVYYPYLENEIIANTLKPYRPVTLLKYVPFLQLMEADDPLKENAVAAFFGKEKWRNDACYKGYFPNGYDTLTLPFKKRYSTLDHPTSEKGIKYLQQIITTLREKKIPLVVIYPPSFKFEGEDLNPDFFPTIRKICAANQVPFIDYSSNWICRDHRLFQDEQHLNKNGANLFTDTLSKDLFLCLQAL